MRKFWIIFDFGQIGPPATKLSALECVNISPLIYNEESLSVVLILAGKENML